MKLTHTIRLIFNKLHKDHYIPNHLIWDNLNLKFRPDDINALAIEPIDHADLESAYTAAHLAFAEVNQDTSCHLKVETTLFLPTMEDSPLEELLDNTTATICTCPA